MGGSVSIVTDGRNGADVYLSLRLNGRGVYELLDTGCNTSVVSRRVILNERLKPTTPKLYAVNGREMVLLGEVEFTLMLADYDVTAAVVVDHCLNHIYVPKQHHTHCMTLRQRGHNFELPKLKYQTARSSFINRSLLNYV